MVRNLTRAFYSCRALEGWEGPSIIPHMWIMDGATYLTTGKTDRAGTILGCPVDTYLNTLYDDKVRDMSSWEEVYDHLNVEPLAHYESISVIGGIDLWRSKLTRYSKRVGVFPKDNRHLKFTSTGKHLCSLLAILKANRVYGVPIHELAFDPNEMALCLVHDDYKPLESYRLYHGYDVPLYNMTRLDTLQYAFSRANKFSYDKDYEFTFGYTILENSSRLAYVDDVNCIADVFAKKMLLCKNFYTGEDSLMPKLDYLDMLERSDYTYILPAYDTNCFSIYRFLEALHVDCVPLIHPDCNTQDVERSFEVDLSFLKNSIPYDRQAVLDYLKPKMLMYQNGFLYD